MLTIFIAYLIFALWGIFTMEQGLDYEKLLLKSDPLVQAVAVEIDLFHGGDQVFFNLPLYRIILLLNNTN